MIKHKLCGIETVCSLAGATAERVYELVDDGQYLWVWNISIIPADSRALRFWSTEINRKFLETITRLDTANYIQRFKLDQVITQIVPNRSGIPGQYDGLRQWELCNLLRITRKHLSDLSSQLPQRRTSRGFVIPRKYIEHFLRSRWCGNFQKRPGLPLCAN